MSANDNIPGFYIFGVTGKIKEIIYPSKAIIIFKNKGKDEKAILLVQKLIWLGVNLDEHKIISDFLKAGETVEFDCHIYNKEGYENFKDHCNYYVIRAWKTSENLRDNFIPTKKSERPPFTIGTGWISEIFPRKGILVFSNSGQDERVLFLASKVYIFEKRLGTKQSLDQVLTTGDLLQFEAVPQDIDDNPYKCPWFASLIWRGKRPPFDEPPPADNSLSVKWANCLKGNNGSSDTDSSSESVASTSIPLPAPTQLMSPTDKVIHGNGYIAGLVDEACGLIWWVLRPNHFQSVWFSRNEAFLFGLNLSKHDLRETFKPGDPVNFIAIRTSTGPTNWLARQVMMTKKAESVWSPLIW